PPFSVAAGLVAARQDFSFSRSPFLPGLDSCRPLRSSAAKRIRYEDAMKLCSWSGLRDNASVLLRVSLFALLPLWASEDARSDESAQVSADFRERFDPALFRLMGGPTPADFCRLEKSGVRCQIPAGDSTVNYCGL